MIFEHASHGFADADEFSAARLPDGPNLRWIDFEAVLAGAVRDRTQGKCPLGGVNSRLDDKKGTWKCRE
jgi:hypothetical protein